MTRGGSLAEPIMVIQRRPANPKGKSATVAKRRTANLTPEIEGRLKELAAKTRLTVPALLRLAVDDLLARFDRDGHL
jgi:Ribbon-helix-helix domain